MVREYLNIRSEPVVVAEHLFHCLPHALRQKLVNSCGQGRYVSACLSAHLNTHALEDAGAEEDAVVAETDEAYGFLFKHILAHLLKGKQKPPQKGKMRQVSAYFLSCSGYI